MFELADCAKLPFRDTDARKMKKLIAGTMQRGKTNFSAKMA